jgi:hypothetical protein
VSPKKRPKTRPEAVGSGARQPKAADPRPFDDRDVLVTFSFAYVDRELDGEWGWPCGDELHEMLRFFADYSRVTWRQVDQETYNGAGGYRKRKNHPMPFDSVCPEARERLQELKLDQIFYEFFRFRLGTNRRFWGFRREGVFYPLWWDPSHKVYPLDN